jgi:hypothetical protein
VAGSLSQRGQMTEVACDAHDQHEGDLTGRGRLLAKLKGLGRAVGPEDGLDVPAFRQRVLDQTTKKFPQWADTSSKSRDPVGDHA